MSSGNFDVNTLAFGLRLLAARISALSLFWRLGTFGVNPLAFGLRLPIFVLFLRKLITCRLQDNIDLCPLTECLMLSGLFTTKYQVLMT